MLRDQIAHSRPAAAALGTSEDRSGIVFVGKLWRTLFRDFLSSYRPELHYMRGPGPRWRERHCAVPARDGARMSCPKSLI